jgi:2-methylisocitrate lyase-like PEP mutase family enzyme
MKKGVPSLERHDQEPKHMKEPPHPTLREDMATRDIIPFIGVYDVFSASIAAKYFDALFISGFGFAASYYGLPDIGFITWTDIVAFVQRVRTVLPRCHLLVDIDDGYCDVEVACHVVSLLEAAGASGVVLEDQKRPRRCGHFEGKQLLELGDYLEKLKRVLATRREMVVVARTDAVADEERAERARAFAKAGADAILIDGIQDLTLLTKLRQELGRPMMFNQIAGGKSPNVSLAQLRDAGVSLVNYSTPCLFPAQESLEMALQALRAKDGMLPTKGECRVGVAECTSILKENLARRDGTP